MSIKHILITEPANPILRRLAMEFLHKPDLLLVCFDGGEGGDEEHLLQMLFTTEQGHFRFRNCMKISVDEIWHSANPADSMEECRKKTERALLLAGRQKAAVLHYVSASTVAALRSESFANGTSWCSNQEQKHRMNETAIEQSGCKFRIYRLPFSPEMLFHPAAEWARFFQRLTRFKIEIEDRIPRYFIAQPLRLYLPASGTIDVACMGDMAQAMEQLPGNSVDEAYFHIRTPQPLLLAECLCGLAESVGMRLQIVPNGEQQNYVDRLFVSRIETFLRQLERSVRITAGVVSENSSTGKIWLSVPSISLQEFVEACHLQLQSSPGEPSDWKSGFEQRQVLLPDGGALNYYVGGQGQKTLVLLNAYGQSFGYWERFFQAVSPWLRIILWTPRGNDGDTIGLKVANSQMVHADDLEKVLRQEGIEKCTLLAWCSGPKLALEYYQRYPDRISSMVFVAASFKGLQQHRALETDYEKNLEPLLEAIGKYPETADVVLEYLKGTLLGKQARSMDELAAISDRELQQSLSAVNASLQELVLHPFHAANVVAYARQMCEFWKHDFMPALDKARVPVLFVGGDCDRIASQALAKVIAGMMPEARYLEIKGGSHYIHYDQWDLMAEITGQVVNSGGRLEFSTPRSPVGKFPHEPVGARQN